MFLKHFLLSTLLALSAVSAMPNPNTDDHGVEARDNGDPAGNLVDRDHGFDCGRDAEWDWKNKQCVCKKADQEYDERHKKCHCPRDQKWDHEMNKCMHDCGMDADWDWTKSVCVCKNKDKDYDEDSKECKCTGGRWWDEQKNMCRCPKGKKFDRKLHQCRRRHS